MMNKRITTITWAIRIIVSFLFLLSAVAKLFPIWSFEKQLVDLGITTWCQSHYFARLIIALEIAIGIAILLPHYLKRIVIPGTILLLLAFCTHLMIEMIKHGAMNGNCGCFGQLIPMTPLEAFIKNIITIGLLTYLWTKVSDLEKGKNKFIYLLACYFGAAFLVFLLFPFCPCSKAATADTETQLVVDTTVASVIDTADINQAIKSSNADTVKSKSSKNNDKNSIVSTTTSDKKAPVEVEAPMAHSKFSNFTTFGNVKVNLNKGKKIVCMFAPGCDHCQATAKELGKLSQQAGFPEVYILFMDEEADKIPTFFKIAEKNFPYKVLDIPLFWETIGSFGSSASTPAVFYLKNGTIIKYYQGIEEEKFNSKDLVERINK